MTQTAEAAATVSVRFELAKTPSHSKGWARIKATSADKRVIESRTGNEWVSASHSGQVQAGSEIVLTTQISLAVGKGRTARQTLTTDEYRLIAEEGATCQVGNSWDYLHVIITGARLA